MKKIKLLIPAFAALATTISVTPLCSCNKHSNDEDIKLSKIKIKNAKNIFIVKPSALNDKPTLWQTTLNNEVKQVEGETEDGKPIYIYPTWIKKINDDFIVINLSNDQQWLININDEKCYELNNFDIKKDTNCFEDKYGNIYLKATENITSANSERICKVNLTDPDNVTIEAMSAQTDTFHYTGSTCWAVDKNGNLFYSAYRIDHDVTVFKKAGSSEFKEVHYGERFAWQNFDGAMYILGPSVGATLGGVYKINDEGELIQYGLLSHHEPYYRPTPDKCFIIKNQNKVIFADTSPYIIDLYNGSTYTDNWYYNDSEELDYRYTSISDNEIYLCGNTKIDKFVPTGLSYSDDNLIHIADIPAGYDLTNFYANNDGTFTLNALRLRDGAYLVLTYSNGQFIESDIKFGDAIEQLVVLL